MSEYHLALIICGQRYRDMQLLADPRNKDELSKFIAEFIAGCVQPLPVPKLCRWLGYIQGTLIERGVTTVEVERNWTRPLFRPLDFSTEE